MSPITNPTFTEISLWQPAAWLRVAGPDAAVFLQGQFTNDLAKSTATYGLWLNVKGKVLADSFVIRAGEAFWIGSYASPAATIKERLESHIIADDVTVEDVTTDWSAVTIWGEAAAALLAAPPAEGVAFPGRRSAAATTEWVFPRTEAAAVQGRLAGAMELDADEVERRRIDAGIPSVPADIGPGDLPNEAGLEADAISYTKGCYLGQEVMARLKSMGQVRRRLLRVRGAGARPPQLPAPVFARGRQVGELRSAAALPGGGCVGLAMVSLLNLGDTTELSLAADAPATWSVIDRP